MSAKIGLTPHILTDYTQTLGQNPHFQAWFAAAQVGNRFLISQPSEAPSKLSKLPERSFEYGVASYYSAGKLYACAASKLRLDQRALAEIGVKILDVSEAPPENIPGDNPVMSLSLTKNGRASPEILHEFALPEDEIIIYDKYINEAGLQLIEGIAAKLGKSSVMHIRTTMLGNNCMRPPTIIRRITAANPNLTYTCKIVSTQFRQQAHDRYIFFGKRLQAVLSAGLDCFGPRRPDGSHRNKQSKVNVYALEAGQSLSIPSDDGTILLTPFIGDHHC